MSLCRVVGAFIALIWLLFSKDKTHWCRDFIRKVKRLNVLEEYKRVQMGAPYLCLLDLKSKPDN